MLGIGTDIVDVRRVELVWRRHGERFAARILTPEEWARGSRSRDPWRFLARRFAAKEAIAKALGTGIGIELSWQDLRITRAPRCAPQVHLSGRARALAAKRGGNRVLLSLSDEQSYAVAFAALLA